MSKILTGFIIGVSITNLWWLAAQGHEVFQCSVFTAIGTIALITNNWTN